jgi:maleylacetate reductase
MKSGMISFGIMERVIFGEATAAAVAKEAERIGAKRVFLLVGGTLNRETDEVQKIILALGPRFCGLHDNMPSHSPRDAVIECANAARLAKADLLVTFGGGSVTDGGKAVTICLEHGITDIDELDPYRTTVDATGKRHFPEYTSPRVRQIAVPTTLSGGEFNARAGVTEPRLKLKQSYVNRGIMPISVILDGKITRHTPEWLFLSTGVRAVDHAVETYLSLDANDYWDGAALHALRLLNEGLSRVKADPDDFEARQKCLMGAWLSMTGIVSGCRLGASHAIGHILGGTAGVPHGHTSCVMLPSVLEWNKTINSERQANLSEAFGKPNTPASEILHDLIDGLGMPRNLTTVGVKREQFQQLAENCMLDDWTFSNPRKINAPEQVIEILELAI